MADILVLGATGYSGRLVTQYLLEHPQLSKSFTFAIGVRSRKKLLSFFPNLPSSIPVYELDVTNFDQIEAAVKKVKVVASTVGPYWKFGKPVVHACARNGVHYVDITGETAWIYDIIHEYDYLASKTHAIIVPSCGFDSIPADASVHLANKTLKALSTPSTPSADISSSISAVVFKGRIGPGTFETALTFFELPKRKKAFSERDWSLSPVTGPPSPPPRLVYTLPYAKPPVHGGFFIMRNSNRAIVQRTAGLLAYSAQSESFRDKADMLPYGPRFTYDEFLVQPNYFVSLGLTLAAAIGGVCLAFFAPARWLFKMLMPKSGEGPSPESLKDGRMKWTNISISDSAPGTQPTRIRTVVRGDGDPGLLLTAIMLAESALCLLPSSGAHLPPLAKQGGILTPMTAMGDALIERLKETGKFEFDSEVLLGDEEENRKAR